MILLKQNPLVQSFQNLSTSIANVPLREPAIKEAGKRRERRGTRRALLQRRKEFLDARFAAWNGTLLETVSCARKAHDHTRCMSMKGRLCANQFGTIHKIYPLHLN